MFARVPVRRRLGLLVAMALWLGFVLYPDPRALFVSVQRLVQPPIDAAAVRELAATLPRDPAAIDRFSHQYVKYDYAWTLYGKPWYFPTVSQVLTDHAGDCQAEAILTASLFKAKNLPFTIRYSFDHVWVDYPGKQVTSGIEDPATAFASGQGKGWLAGLPDKLPIRDIVQQRLQFHWYPMPTDRKAALLAGLLVLVLFGELLPPGLVRVRRRHGAMHEVGPPERAH